MLSRADAAVDGGRAGHRTAQLLGLRTAHLGVPILAAPALLALGWLAAAVADAAPVAAADRAASLWLHDQQSTVVAAALERVAYAGHAAAVAAVVVLAGGLAVRRGDHGSAMLVLLAYSGSEVLAFVLKHLLAQPRPRFADGSGVDSMYSFPSRHALVACAVYGAIAWVVARRLRRPRAQAGVAVMGALLVAMIAVGRVYLGLHYTSDVVAGIALALGWLAACIYASDRRAFRTTAARAGGGRSEH